jgi:hypothetical protein
LLGIAASEHLLPNQMTPHSRRVARQVELTALERGMHALHSGMDVKAYAADVGRNRATVSTEVLAAKVAEACATHVAQDLSDHFRSLTEIHAAPRWLWSALVSCMAETASAIHRAKRLEIARKPHGAASAVLLSVLQSDTATAPTAKPTAIGR